jgi:hypothetical protein
MESILVIKHSEGILCNNRKFKTNFGLEKSHQMCNGSKVYLIGEHPDIAPFQFVICVMKYET